MNEKLYYILLSEDNRITMLTVEKQNEEQVAFEFPQDFNVSDIINYQIIDDELIYNPIPIPEPEHIVPIEDRVAELEETTEITSDTLGAVMETILPTQASSIEELSTTLDTILTDILPSLMVE